MASCRSASSPWTFACLAAGSLMARCMRWRGAGKGRPTEPLRPSSPPPWRGRTRGKVLWCVTRTDIFPPALAGVGLKPDRVVYFEAGDEKAVLTAFEDGLRHGGFGAVVGEVARLSMTASRRLQLSAEESGSLGLAVRRWRREAEAADFGQPTVAVTRWRVSALPSTPMSVQGVGRARWFVELVRCRAAECAEFELEAPDETGRLALPADLADRSGQASPWERRAAG